MTNISERIKVYTIFDTAVLPEFSTKVLLLVDHVDAGANVGDYKAITPYDYESELTSGQPHYDWTQIFFSQRRVADNIIVGRYTGAAEAALSTALATIKSKTNDFWAVCAVGATQAQLLHLSASVEASRQNLLCFVSNDVDIIGSGTADVASVLKDLGRSRTIPLFAPYDAKTSYLDAALLGCILPAPAGSVTATWQEIRGVLASSQGVADITPITAAQKANADAKNCSYCEDINGIKMVRKGVTCSGLPLHLLLGADWMNASIQNMLFQYMLKTDSPSFSNQTIAAVEGIVRTGLNSAVERGLIIDTEEQPIEFKFPNAAEISSAQKATGKLIFPNCYKCVMAYPVLEIEIYGSWSI